VQQGLWERPFETPFVRLKVLSKVEGQRMRPHNGSSPTERGCMNEGGGDEREEMVWENSSKVLGRNFEEFHSYIRRQLSVRSLHKWNFDTPRIPECGIYRVGLGDLLSFPRHARVVPLFPLEYTSLRLRLEIHGPTLFSLQPYGYGYFCLCRSMGAYIYSCTG